MTKHILEVSGFSSRCGTCGQSADPHEETHGTMLGYGATNGQPGCGVRWTHIASYYAYPGMADRLKAMRPDLIVECVD